MVHFRMLCVVSTALILMSGCRPQAPQLDDTPVTRGEAVFKGVGACSLCHAIRDDTVLVGPSLKGIASRAAQRERGVSAQAYIQESIVTPDRYLVPGFQAGLMPQTYNERLSQGQIDDLVAYLMTLK
jgi:nitric oxide reductase subunit C